MDNYADYNNNAGLYHNSGVLRVVQPPTMAGNTRGNRISDITDGTSSTTMVVECAGRDQHWLNGQLDTTIFTTGNWTGRWINPNNHLEIRGLNQATKTQGWPPETLTRLALLTARMRARSTAFTAAARIRCLRTGPCIS